MFLDGFEFHVYNRSQTYAHLEKLFGLEPNIIPEQPESEAKTKARYSGAHSLTPMCVDSAVNCVCIICFIDSLHLYMYAYMVLLRRSEFLPFRSEQCCLLGLLFSCKYV